MSSGITEQGYRDGTGAKTPNAFSLQLNSEFFAGSPACSGSSNPAKCQAWQQFAYTYEGSATSTIFMQYWLLDYAASCPSGWTKFTTDCYTNSKAVQVSTLTAGQLATTQLSGNANSGGDDGVSLSAGSGQATSVTNRDSVIGLASHWTTTQWGVYGDGGGTEAYFGSKTTLQAQTALTATSSSAPSCIPEGFTAETNNLNLTTTPALGGESLPTIASRQTNGTTGAKSCATAAPQQVSLGTLCNHKGVQISAQNGCPYKGETRIGTTTFHYLILIENNDSSVYPAYWDLINFPRNSCQTVKLRFGMPASGSARKDTAWIAVRTKAGLQSLKVKYGQVATLTATLAGAPWSLENSASNANDQIAVTGTASCSTRSGY